MNGQIPNRQTPDAPPGLSESVGSVTLTYAELEALLQNCRWGIESAPAEDPPDGYEALPPEQAEIADACWHRGMEQLSAALLNYWYDHGAAPVSPNGELCSASDASASAIGYSAKSKNHE